MKNNVFSFQRFSNEWRRKSIDVRVSFLMKCSFAQELTVTGCIRVVPPKLILYCNQFFRYVPCIIDVLFSTSLVKIGCNKRLATKGGSNKRRELLTGELLTEVYCSLYIIWEQKSPVEYFSSNLDANLL